MDVDREALGKSSGQQSRLDRALNHKCLSKEGDPEHSITKRKKTLDLT